MKRKWPATALLFWFYNKWFVEVSDIEQLEASWGFWGRFVNEDDSPQSAFFGPISRSCGFEPLTPAARAMLAIARAGK